MRRIAIAILLTSFSAGAQAAPFCHDSKGLFTPCVGAPQPGAPSVRHRGDGRIASPASAAAVAEIPGHGAAPKPAASDRPRPTRRARSCRDSKGLFKPC